MSQPATRPVAVVTGASSGIGATVVQRLLADGWGVLAASRRRPDLEHPALRFVEADLLDPATAVPAVVAALDETGERPTAIVHAAGVMRPGSLGALEPDDGAQLWRLHVDAPTRLVNALADRIVDGGRVVLLGSRTSTGVAGRSQYAASKAALDGLSRSWAQELVGRQITVNVVAPGATETPMLKDPARVGTPPKLPPMGRFVQPEEIAELVVFLLGPYGRSITGQRLVVCAGASL